MLYKNIYAIYRICWHIQFFTLISTRIFIIIWNFTILGWNRLGNRSKIIFYVENRFFREKNEFSQTSYPFYLKSAAFWTSNGIRTPSNRITTPSVSRCLLEKKKCLLSKNVFSACIKNPKFNEFSNNCLYVHLLPFCTFRHDYDGCAA